ncbi:histidinol-phosphate transaminase [Clostridium saccharobutylicum]|uniref:Histidinol-phosphate aminotransferase n=1 Tax=Clostridium saccharobutylicum DSM 13864 TaxID=1345695 RepID=U5MQD1_CLOSA|nr:histidinol-phosphate transaminase [Clostridium saccharobutylicum]AGX42733.1 histidinol-phosphate aminotransferase HisC [Clostridium saccharobutylicum DSM 13864]AQR90028.1 histidinol-phosphate aminotransferase [Clostridium saccharobutylicum]AQR99933.1 histidinol-phosphate aminotransferase [Clostridium saccharobutylicum]AQS13917.1 histidinol-phosphate aminotransferase [Clostridium saccharobutylicum]MBA2904676.1 histidinol-phosphate aminotransferase [Clostridium saccharobutylicum]
MSKYWNETVNNIEPYIPGEQPKDKKYIKLNTNENPYPPSKKAIEAMENVINDDLKLYPDPTCSELISEIAVKYGVDEDEVFVGNGSDEVLAFSFMTFFSREKRILFPDISYTFYKVYSELFKLNYELVKLDDDFNIPLDEFKKSNGGIIIPNPNAPTGKYIDTENLRNLIEVNKESVVIIDEAYVDFGGESMVKFIKDYQNLLVVQTLSKSRSLAGMRVGFALGHRDLIEGLNRIKNSMNSYTIDRVALAGAKAAINDNEYFNEITKKIINTRENSTNQLRELGFKVLESKANFIFVTHEKANGKFLYESLKDNGILVRYFNKDRIDNYLRITIGTDNEMDVLIEKIKTILENL